MAERQTDLGKKKLAKDPDFDGRIDKLLEQMGRTPVFDPDMVKAVDRSTTETSAGAVEDVGKDGLL